MQGYNSIHMLAQANNNKRPMIVLVDHLFNPINSCHFAAPACSSSKSCGQWDSCADVPSLSPLAYNHATPAETGPMKQCGSVAEPVSAVGPTRAAE